MYEKLPFRELCTLACLSQTVFFTFDLSCITGQEMVFTEHRFRFGIVPLDRSGNSEFTSVRLPGCSAPFNFDQDIDCTIFTRENQGSLYCIPLLDSFEEFIQFPIVDTDSAASRPNPYSGNGRFPPSCTKRIVLSVSFNDVVAKFNHCILRCSYFVASSRGCGCCA